MKKFSESKKGGENIMKKILKWAGFGFLILIVLGVIAGAGKSTKTTPSTTTSNTETAVQPTQATPMKVTASQIADAFDANQVSAEAEWKGKLVEFSATVSNITERGLSFQNVSSKEVSFTQISCRIKDKQQLLSLKNGQTVTVRGIVGSQTVGVIDVGDCEVVM